MIRGKLKTLLLALAFVALDACFCGTLRQRQLRRAAD
jgi:hypothetical protein